MTHFTEAEHLKWLRTIDQGTIIFYYLLEGKKHCARLIYFIITELNMEISCKIVFLSVIAQ